MAGFSLPLADEGQGPECTQWAGTSRIRGPTWSHLPVITVGLLGFQIFWTVEMSYASPYLLSLGLNKSLMAMVFVAGPLSGLIVQPVIGVLTDRSKSRFGRRRPFMFGGVVFSVVAMLLLGFTRKFASIFAATGSTPNDALTVWLAIFAVYGIDFSVNVVMAVDRALLVDVVPTSEQSLANAWGARMIAIGSVLGFFLGEINLVDMFPQMTQLQALVILSSFLFFFSHLLTIFSVREKVLLSSTLEKGLLDEFKAMFANILTLPRTIRQIFLIQFFAWLGWFPVLFYTTIYVGELYKRASPIPTTPAATRALDAEATRIGSRALFFSSLLSLFVNIVFPFFVVESAQPSPSHGERGWRRFCRVRLVSLWTLSHFVFSSCMMGTFFTNSVAGATFLMTVTGFSWAITLWAPFTLLAEAILNDSGTDSNTSIRMSGRRSSDGHASRVPDSNADEHQHFLVEEEDEDDEGEDNKSWSKDSAEELESPSQPVLPYSGARLSVVNLLETAEDDGEIDEEPMPQQKKGGLSGRTGVILGVHNLFIVIPQFLITGLSSIIFAIFEPEKSVLHGKHPGSISSSNSTTPVGGGHALFLPREEQPQAGVNSVAIIFRIGGVATAVAFVLCWRLARELR